MPRIFKTMYTDLSYFRVVSLITFMLLLGNLRPVFAESVTLNLNNADIGNLIATVAEVTGKNFVVDPRVKGKVTVISSKGMDSDEIYQVFLSILQVHGFAAVESGNLIKIVPDANAKQISTPFATDNIPGLGDEMVTRILRVKNVAAAQLVPLLRPLVPQQGHLAAYAATNVLIVSDRASNISRLVTLIERIDKVSDSEMEIIPLQYASAAEIVRLINNLQKQPTKGLKGGPNALTMVADERTNSIILGGESSNRLRTRMLIAHLDTPLKSTGNTQVIYLRYAKALDIQKVLTDVSQTLEAEESKKKGTKSATGAKNISIQADESTNALVITAPPDIMSSLQMVIRKLDIRRAQVLIEAIIVEVGDNDTKNLGVQWQTSKPGANGVGNDAYGKFILSGSGTTDFTATTNPLTSLASGLSLGFFRNGDLRLIVNALASVSTSNFLGTPSLVTMDNEEAEIVVGDEINVTTGQFTNDGNNATNPFQTTERKDVGVKLKVTPQINEGNAVRLELESEVSSVKPNSTTNETNKRTLKTTVLVDDKDVLVIGGLIQDKIDHSNDKVPVLGDIPLVGGLFNARTSTLRKVNLMVFLKPTILRDGADNRLITNSKYNFIRSNQLSIDKPNDLVEPDTHPVLPDLDILKSGSFEKALTHQKRKSQNEANNSSDSSGNAFNWDSSPYSWQ